MLIFASNLSEHIRQFHMLKIAQSQYVKQSVLAILIRDELLFWSPRFLQRVSIALAMQSAVLAMIDSVCLTV